MNSIKMGFLLRTFLPFLIFYLLFFPTRGFAQLAKEWEFYLPTDATYIPSFSVNSDAILKTIKTDDDNFVTLGKKKRGESDVFFAYIYIFNYSSTGEILWEYTFSSPDDISDEAFDIAMDSENNILVGGKTTTYYYQGFEFTKEYSSYLLFKLSPDGELLWELTFPGQDNSNNFCKSIKVDTEDNIYTTGKISANELERSMVNKISKNGEILWTTYLDAATGYVIELKNDQIFVVTKFYSEDSKLYHLNLDGEISYSSSLPGVGRNRPVFDANSNIYVFTFNGDFKIDKFDKFGNHNWTYEKYTNLPYNVYADEITDCYIDDSENLYVTGRYYGEHYGDSLLYSRCDILTAKIDPDGDKLWENIYKGQVFNTCQIGERIIGDGNGNIYVAGYESDINKKSSMVLLKYNAQGEIIENILHHGLNESNCSGQNVIVKDEEVYLLGWSHNLPESFDHNIVKYSKNASSISSGINELAFEVYPNPNNGTFYINTDSAIVDLYIFNSLGQLVHQDKNKNHNSTQEMIVNLNAGIYYLKLILANGKSITKPWLLYK